MSPPWRSGRRILTSLVLGAVGLIAAAALVDALRGGPSSQASPPEEPVEATDDRLPGRGVLTGRLVFSSLAGCRPHEMDLETLSLGTPGRSLECRLWVSPRGDLAVAAVAPALGLRGSDNWLLRLGEPPTLVRPLGVARGEPAWSADGERLAWCAEDEETVVLTLETRARAVVRGCRPVFAPDGSILTRPARLLAPTLLRNGSPLLVEKDLLHGFPAGEGPLDLVGYDARPDGLLAVVAVRFESGRRPRRLLQLWRDGRLESAVLLPELNLPAGYGRLGERLELSPDGREVAVAFPGLGRQMVLVDLETLSVTLEPTLQHGFAWSPDGRWFALSTGEEVRVLGPDREEPVYVLPIGAAAIAWR